MLRSTLASALLLVLIVAGSGCHTSLRRPPALCQCMEDKCGDCVDAVGRCTPISNPRKNHCVTRTFRSCGLTRNLGECIATGGPHYCR